MPDPPAPPIDAVTNVVAPPPPPPRPFVPGDPLLEAVIPLEAPSPLTPLYSPAIII